VRLHVKKHPEAMERFDVMWTPTVLILDSGGNERYRIEGFLPTNDFLAQLHLGLAHTAFKTGRFDEAEKRFRTIVDQFPDNDAAAEAQYWAGVSKYKGSGDAAALGATAKAFHERYSDSPWAKKASIWG
jgi:outer membrane protein assembly factor BamD (BamD/ComL family)